MNGGEDVCSWAGNGTLVSSPRCKCQQGFAGRYCQESLARNRETVYSQLSTTLHNPSKPDSSGEENVLDPEFPAKLDNALEMLS